MTITANLTWQPTGGAADSFSVFRAVDGAEATEIHQTTALEYADATLEVGHVYEYTVEASNQFGSADSNEVTGDTRPPTAASLFVSLVVVP